MNERTYRRQFEQEVDFVQLNRTLIEQTIEPTHRVLAVMDCSFIAKSGKATCGRDWYWNGCANRVEQGLEVSLIGVVDVETQRGYALSAQQTFAQKDLPDLTRMDQYLYHLDTMRCELPPSVKYLAVDGAYAKENFVTGAVHLQLHVISKLRCDANLRWLYTGEQKPRGRRRKYDGFFQVNHSRAVKVCRVHSTRCRPVHGCGVPCLAAAQYSASLSTRP